METLLQILWFRCPDKKHCFKISTEIDRKMLTCVCRPVSSNLPKLTPSANLSPKKRQQNQLYQQQQKEAINVVTCEPKIESESKVGCWSLDAFFLPMFFTSYFFGFCIFYVCKLSSFLVCEWHLFECDFLFVLWFSRGNDILIIQRWLSWPVNHSNDECE